MVSKEMASNVQSANRKHICIHVCVLSHTPCTICVHVYVIYVYTHVLEQLLLTFIFLWFDANPQNH